MALEGLAAIQSRIQEIRQQVTGVSTVASAAPTQSADPTKADFASMLSGAMSTQAATATGDTGVAGSGTGTGTGTGTDLSSMLQSLTGGGAAAGSPDISSLLAQMTGASGAPGATAAPEAAAVAGSPNVTAQFLTNVLTQNGKPYVWGAVAAATDPNPAAFDCSELTKWAAARAGVTIPDGAAHQYVWLKEQGATMPVEQALHTPGALLFRFDSEPQPGLTGEPEHAHVAISLGDGRTIEAKGHAYGVGVFDASNFDYAGMIPGMT